jgi:hypothetical protein
MLQKQNCFHPKTTRQRLYETTKNTVNLSLILALPGTQFFISARWDCPSSAKATETPNYLTTSLQIDPNIGVLRNIWSSVSGLPQPPPHTHTHRKNERIKSDSYLRKVFLSWQSLMKSLLNRVDMFKENNWFQTSLHQSHSSFSSPPVNSRQVSLTE